MKAKVFDKKFDDDELDLIEDLDLSTLSRPNQRQRLVRANVDAKRGNEMGLILIPLQKAVASLELALQQPKDEFIRDAVIQRFGYTYELC